MLEQLLIFTRGGLILWSCKEIGCALKGSPIDTLIRSCLLEERGGDRSFRYDTQGASYTLKWTFHNELGLVFVAVYQQFLHLLYVDELLSLVKREFAQAYSPNKTASYGGFDEVYRQLLKEAQARAEANRGLNKPVKQIEDAGSRKIEAEKGIIKNGGSSKPSGKKSARKSSKSGGDGVSSAQGKKSDKSDEDLPVNEKIDNGLANGKTISSSDEESKDLAFDRSKLEKLKAKGGKKAAGAKKDEPKKKVKENRVWNRNGSEKNLDYSHSEDVANVEEEVVQGDSLVDVEEEDEDDSDEEEAQMQNEAVPAKKGWFSSVFQSVTGKAALEKADLEPAMKALKDRLMTKNVAEEIAAKICESVAASLIGKKLGSFTRVSSAVKAAMEDALLRILTPKRSIDILRAVQSAKEEGRPYVIVFVGVNGVGKSTNLAKVAYWLKNHEFSVRIAACDTFRSGAVEQLLTHARRLGIKVYDQGYDRDPAHVAKEGIAEAAKQKQDVVLVDTAGRMQDNEPLMKALANLINVNKPDLVLFVGEALVGNEAVDQLTKFNQKLADYSTSGKPRLVDGIILTKFDTIDDKVGAALSMVYVSGAPIMFIGCGQNYQDLRRINVRSIVRTLLA